MSDLPVPPAIAKIAPDGKLTPRQKRRFLIDMSLRKQKPGTGSSLEFLKRRTAMIEWPDFRQILQGIPWVIIGGVATRAYMPERMTKDMDILIHKNDGQEVIQRLQKAGYTVISQLAVPGHLLQSPTGVEVDVLFGDTPWLKDALAQPQFDAARYPVLDLPYLVLLKLQAMRPQDWTDVSRMLGLASDEVLNQVREAITQYSPEDSDDLESLIYLGKLETEMPTDED